MDSVFLLYLYTMIVMGCLTVWAGLYYHFVQTGVVTFRPPAADRESSAAPTSLTASGEQQRRSQSQLVTDVDVHQQQKEKTPEAGR